jgi:protein-disulfide isomerase
MVCARTPAAFSQTAEDIQSLRRDADAIRDSQKVIKDQLDAIQKLLQQALSAAAGQPQAFKEATLNVEGDYSMGDKSAKVTLIEFTDYQCPYCGRNFQQTLPRVVAEYVRTGKVRYILRDFPLEPIHPLAFKAAEAARCGGEQGKYWEMHDRLFSNQSALSGDALLAHAKAVGLDPDKFNDCLASGKEVAKIRGDMAEGQKNGITGTPAFFLGLTQPNERTVKATKRIVGAQPYASFKEAIDDLLIASK